jgi:hypothetical protein
VTYLGCTFIGGIDRIVIAKRDVDRDLCFNVVLSSSGTATPGLSTPPGFGLEYASVGPAFPCPIRASSTMVRASQVVGSIDQTSGGGVAGSPSRVSIDVTLSFAPNDAGAPASETLIAQNVDVQPSCQ